MSKSNLILLYQEWSDERILDEYVNKGADYESEGLEVMLEVIQMKGLGDEANKMLEAKGIREKNAKILAEHLYQQNTFGIEELDADFLERIKTKEGVYFDKIMMLGAKSNLFGFAIAMGIMVLIVGFVFVFSEIMDGLYLLPIFVIAGLLIYWGIQILKRNKVNVIVKDYRGKPKLEIALKDELLEFSAPIDYRCHAILVHVKTRGMSFKRPNLYIMLKHSSGRIFMLHEDQPPQNSMPLNWNELQVNAPELKHDLRITQHGGTKIELEKLKRVLDGLS